MQYCSYKLWITKRNDNIHIGIFDVTRWFIYYLQKLYQLGGKAFSGVRDAAYMFVISVRAKGKKCFQRPRNNVHYKWTVVAVDEAKTINLRVHSRHRQIEMASCASPISLLSVFPDPRIRMFVQCDQPSSD